MARLTWQNVQAPNFSGVTDAMRLSSDLLNRAAQSGLGAVESFQTARQTAADNAIMQRLAQVQDASQFNPQDILGSSGQYASRAVLDSVMQRPEQLATLDWRKASTDAVRDGNQRAAAAEGRAATQFNQEQQLRKELVDAGPILNALLADASRTGRMDHGRLNTLLSSVSPQAAEVILGQLNDQVTTSLAHTGKRQQINMTADQIAELEAMRRAEALIAEAKQNNRLFDPAAALQWRSGVQTDARTGRALDRLLFSQDPKNFGLYGGDAAIPGAPVTPEMEAAIQQSELARDPRARIPMSALEREALKAEFDKELADLVSNQPAYEMSKKLGDTATMEEVAAELAPRFNMSIEDMKDQLEKLSADAGGLSPRETGIYALINSTSARRWTYNPARMWAGDYDIAGLPANDARAEAENALQKFVTAYSVENTKAQIDAIGQQLEANQTEINRLKNRQQNGQNSPELASRLLLLENQREQLSRALVALRDPTVNPAARLLGNQSRKAKEESEKREATKRAEREALDRALEAYATGAPVIPLF